MLHIDKSIYIVQTKYVFQLIIFYNKLYVYLYIYKNECWYIRPRLIDSKTTEPIFTKRST